MAIDRRELERLIPALRRYARGLTGSADAADDLVQDALVSALRHEHQQQGSLAGWVFAILGNAARSARRSERRAPRLVEPVDVAGPGSDMAERTAILAALAALAPEQREALLLTVVEGFSYREAADILAVPLGTVLSRVARARDQLARRLEGAAVVPLRRLK